jgi:hypothetical protein
MNTFLKNGSSSVSRIDILCHSPEPTLRDQCGTNNPLQIFTEGDLRFALDCYAQLQFKPDHKVKIFVPSGLQGAFGLITGSIIASQSLDNLTSKRALFIIEELSNISTKPVAPEQAVRKILHTCDGATRIVVVTDSVLMGSVSSILYRKSFGLKSNAPVPELIAYPEHIAHLAIFTHVHDSNRRLKVIRQM